jgi:prevent-host-death family protein
VRWKEIGLRDAKAKLSELVREASQGCEITITDRGKPVARLVPLDAGCTASLEERLVELEKRGLITKDPGYRVMPPPIPLQEGVAQSFLQEERGR